MGKKPRSTKTAIQVAVYLACVVAMIGTLLAYQGIRLNMQDAAYARLPLCDSTNAASTSCRVGVPATIDEIDNRYTNFFLKPPNRVSHGYMTRIVLALPDDEKTIITEQPIYDLYAGQNVTAYVKGDQVVAIETPEGLHLIRPPDVLSNWWWLIVPAIGFAIFALYWWGRWPKRAGTKNAQEH